MKDLNSKETEIEMLTERLRMEEKKVRGRKQGQKENNKMIHQLSKKLELLLLDNSELREHIKSLESSISNGGHEETEEVS